MRVLLVSTNQLAPSETFRLVPVEPLGLAYVASSVQRAGHEVSFVDLCFIRDPGDAVAREVRRFDPDVIGISFRNIEMMAFFRNITFREELRATVAVCRDHSNAPVVLGGSGFSVMPGQLLRYTGADIGIVGEGEWSFPAVLAGLESGSDVSKIPGTVHVRRGALRFNPPTQKGDCAALPLPARELIDHRDYRAAGAGANIQTKRGCPFKCIYCTYPIVEGSHVRCRPPRDVAGEIRLLHDRYGMEDVYVVDNQFNYPPDHAKAICAEWLAMRDDVKFWWTCMLNPGYIDDDLVFLLRASRCAMVDFGIESASDAVLRGLGKNYTQEDIRRAVGLFNKYNLPFNTWVLFGGPGETEGTIRETVEFLDALDVPRILFSIGIRVCPGTAIEQLMRREGAIGADNDLLEPVFYCRIDPEAVVDIVKPYCAGREEWRIAAIGSPCEETGGTDAVTFR